jgi:hypothetical protein
MAGGAPGAAELRYAVALEERRMNSRQSNRPTAALAAFAAFLFWGALTPNAGNAAGALAVALPPDVAKGGFSYGFSNDNGDADTADAKALAACRNTKDASNDPKLRGLCKVIMDYANKCIAVSMDPDAGTPGVGWAVAADLHTAEANALVKCQETAGPTRRKFCVIDHSGCDGGTK